MKILIIYKKCILFFDKMTYKFINFTLQADVDNEKVRYISKEAANFAKENRIYYFETSSLWSRTEYNYNGNY